jgi:hypothetical protein
MAQKLLSKKYKRRRRIFRFLVIAASLGLIATCLYASVFHIQGVVINGAQHTPISAVEADVRSMITGYRYLIIPHNNIFIYQKNKIQAYILQTYPSVETVDIRIDRHRTMQINIKDRKPLGVWCTDECYLYDTAGVIFKKSFIYTGALFVSWKREGNAVVQLLDSVSCEGLCTDPVFMDFLKRYRIEKAFMSENQLVLTSADGYQIKTGFVASSTMRHISDVLESKPELLKNIEYIDVRFDNKIFYKEKGE